MLLSNYAIFDLTTRRQSLMERLRKMFRLEFDRHPPELSWSHLNDSRPLVALLPSELDIGPTSEMASAYRWRRHPQLLNAAYDTALVDSERRARNLAVHGLYCAHNGETEHALLYFRQALSQHRIELTDVPSFWQMPRTGMLLAADAYEGAGRFRDAARIQARVRTQFRPRTVVPMRPSRMPASSRRTANGD